MNSVKTIIDEWDPIDLLAYAPEDEYDFEIKEIEQILALQIDVDQLAVEIFVYLLKHLVQKSLKRVWKNAEILQEKF